MRAKTPKVDDEVTRTLATYAANTRFAQLPANAVAAAKASCQNNLTSSLMKISLFVHGHRFDPIDLFCHGP